MPPKKAAGATNGEAGEGKMIWEGLNDYKLLLITQGRYVKPEEYEQLSTVFPATTVGSIRNRISALRVKQRDLYEELGWSLPEGGTGHSSKKTPSKNATATPKKTKKRNADEIEGNSDEQETPSKKPRARKGRAVKKEKDEGEEEEKIVKKEEDLSETEVDDKDEVGGSGVKEEEVEV